MKRLSFLEKTKELILYTDRYETVTLFEISQLYGSSLCAFLAFLLSLPVLFIGATWVSLPLCFLILILSTLLLFDEKLWLLDSLKSIKIPSAILKKVAGAIALSVEKLRVWIPVAGFYEQFSTVCRWLNPVILILAAFQVGFIQSPNTNDFSVFSITLVALGTFTDDGYLCLAGYAMFLLGMI
jgi:hypothetical protein